MKTTESNHSPAPISDNELILYFYRDGLSAERMVEIDNALFAQPELRQRYTKLQRVLHDADCALAPEPDIEFTQRVWQRLSARIEAEPTRARLRMHWFAPLPVRLTRFPAYALVCLLAIAGAIGFYAGKHDFVANDDAAQAHTASARVLDAYVADHLRATEGLLLTAVNTDSSELNAANRELASTLVESNRLYALAAARSGNARLADFLRQLEPVLLELANQPADVPVQSREGLREYLRKTDLLFQVRATQARVDAGNRHRT
jgi:hypothetical protein